jgi:hypothetical protein
MVAVSVAVSSTPADPAARDPPAAKPVDLDLSASVDLDLSASALDAFVSLAAFLTALLAAPFLRPPSACTAEANELVMGASVAVSSSVLLCPAVPTYVINV